MKNIVDVIQESKTQPREIENYVKSWLKYPSNSREMYDVIGAIVSGMTAALNYRTDDDYMNQNSKEYSNATDVLNHLVDQMK